MKHKQIMKFLTDKEFQAYLGKEQANYLIEHENLIIPFIKGVEKDFTQERLQQLMFAIAISRFVYEIEDDEKLADELNAKYEHTTDYVECLTNKYY